MEEIERQLNYVRGNRYSSAHIDDFAVAPRVETGRCEFAKISLMIVF